MRCAWSGVCAIRRCRGLRQLAHLLQPEPHVHLAVHRRRGREVLARLVALARAPVELAEAGVTVSDEGPHAAGSGEGQRLAVVALAALGIEPVGMGGDVAEQVQRMGDEPGVTRRAFDRAVSEAPRLVEPAEPQTGASQRVVGPAVNAHDAARGVTLEELLTFAEPAQRFALV